MAILYSIAHQVAVTVDKWIVEAARKDGCMAY